MAGAAMLVSALSITGLYLTAIEQHRLALIDTVKSQARLIEAIARFDLANSPEIENEPNSGQHTLQQVAAAHKHFKGFGESGEFVLAKRKQEQIVFLLSRGHESSPDSSLDTLEPPHPIPFAGQWAEPMRRALSGEAGVLTGLDYRGVQVLAAYEPVSVLDLGLVAKTDISEIRAPFIRAGLGALAAAMLVIFLASRLFYRLSKPIEETIHQQAETFQTLAQTSLEGVVLADTKGRIQFVNSAVLKLFGYREDELLGQQVNILMPREHSVAHDGYMTNYMQTGHAKIIGIGRQLTALRKDGSRFPIYLSIGDINLSHSRMFAAVIMDLSEQRQLQREILEIPVSEQRRIGQELHDGLGQQLTGLSMLATSLLNNASKPEHDLATKLAQGLKQTIAEVRALSRGLMPVDIDVAGFMNALENLVVDLQAQGSVPIVLTINRKILIADKSAALHLYRIAQEAINNALKHASASEIHLSLGLQDNRGCMSIVDDGVGIATDGPDQSGLGLRIMKHRCGLIDADLHITSTAMGTRIECYFPLDKETNPQ